MEIETHLPALETPSYEEVFCDVHQPLDFRRAKVEASRCYYCYDAPCIQACPTGIDIPSFIKKVAEDNIRGSAMDILSANIMGGTCSRACPVEVLCQQACVRNTAEDKPVEIGLLQRYATDLFFEKNIQPFHRAPLKGKRVAVVGGGPAGLSCAHKLSTLGYDVTIFEAKDKLGGLNEFGLAPYKMTGGFAQKEIEFILGVGGIDVETEMSLGHDVTLDALHHEYQAVYLAIGLCGHPKLGIEGEDLMGVYHATDYIEVIRRSESVDEIGVARDVVVIGGGNTAVDIAIEMKKLGARSVTMVYRRGKEQMSATWYEQELAQKNGVVLMTWAKPLRVDSDDDGRVAEILFERTKIAGESSLVGTGEVFSLPAQQVFSAIGQSLHADALKVSGKPLELQKGKLWVNDEFQTSVPGVFAGGDCIRSGEDLTVTAVQHGKLAALAIDRWFSRGGDLKGGRNG